MPFLLFIRSETPFTEEKLTQPLPRSVYRVWAWTGFLGKFIYFVACRCNFSALGNRDSYHRDSRDCNSHTVASRAIANTFSRLNAVKRTYVPYAFVFFFFFFLEPSTGYIHVRTKAKTCRCTITLSAINAMLRGVNATTEQSRALIDF